MKTTVLLALLLLAGRAAAALPPDLQPDGEVTLRSADDLARKRDELIRFVWGAKGIPARMPDRIRKGVPIPDMFGHLQNLKRVDELLVNMELDEHSTMYHFIAQNSNSRLVVMHQGHGCTFGTSLGGDLDYGMASAIEQFLIHGFSVLGVYMPHLEPGFCDLTKYPGDYWAHDYLFMTFKPQEGAVVKFFVEPVAVGLNYLASASMRAKDGFPAYLSYDMTGQSGGGWSTTFYAALDTRIELSFPVAGTVPLYMRKCVNGQTARGGKPPGNCNWGYDGDSEQTFTDTYAVAGYLDLYALGAAGRGRRQIQILNRRDTCCFGEAEFAGPGSGPGAWEKDIRDYEKVVASAVATTIAGSFEVVIDETSTKHETSRWVVANVIIPAMQRGASFVPTPDGGSDAKVDVVRQGDAGRDRSPGSADIDAAAKTTEDSTMIPTAEPVRPSGSCSVVTLSIGNGCLVTLGGLALALLALRRRSATRRPARAETES